MSVVLHLQTYKSPPQFLDIAGFHLLCHVWKNARLDSRPFNFTFFVFRHQRKRGVEEE